MDPYKNELRFTGRVRSDFMADSYVFWTAESISGIFKVGPLLEVPVLPEKNETLRTQRNLIFCRPI